jgi:hypothetical protein
VEDTPIKMVVMGDAYLQREKTNKPSRFVCLIGEKGKVVLTFFTQQWRQGLIRGALERCAGKACGTGAIL